MERSRIVVMGYVIQEFLEKENLQNAKPKDLMSVLVVKGFFKQDNRFGLPLRKVLRDLDNKNLLYLIPQVKVERKELNRYWYFNALKR